MIQPFFPIISNFRKNKYATIILIISRFITICKKLLVHSLYNFEHSIKHSFFALNVNVKVNPFSWNAFCWKINILNLKSALPLYHITTSQNNFSTPSLFAKITKCGPDKTNNNHRHNTDSTTQQAHPGYTNNMSCKDTLEALHKNAWLIQTQNSH